MIHIICSNFDLDFNHDIYYIIYTYVQWYQRTEIMSQSIAWLAYSFNILFVRSSYLAAPWHLVIQKHLYYPEHLYYSYLLEHLYHLHYDYFTFVPFWFWRWPHSCTCLATCFTPFLDRGRAQILFPFLWSHFEDGAESFLERILFFPFWTHFLEIFIFTFQW